MGEILKTINTQIRLVLTIVLHLSPTVLAIVYVFWEMVYSCIQNEGFQTFLPFCLAQGIALTTILEPESIIRST